MQSSLKVFLISVLIPLACGTSIYLLQARSSIRIPTTIRNYLPDMLWTYSFTSLQCIIWKMEKQFVKRVFIFLPLPVSFTLEFLQKFHFIAGTFDVPDLLIYSVGWTLSIVTFYFLNIKKIT